MLDILVCPICKGRLQLSANAEGLICRADKLVYPIDDGIAIMLESQAKPLEAETGP
jgi:uncharacterized protein YbaR (Trm112 family)